MKKKTETISLIFEGRNVIVKIVYNQKYKINIKINKENKLTFYTYKKMKDKLILDLMNENKESILKAWEKIENIKKQNVDLKEGEVLIFGKAYSLLDINYQEEYNKALKYIENLFFENQSKFNFPDCTLRMKKLKSAWGLCYPIKKDIVLNTHLTILPIHLVEYVILHELSHLYVRNHGKEFYQELSKYCPGCKKIRKELKKYSYYL